MFYSLITPPSLINDLMMLILKSISIPNQLSQNLEIDNKKAQNNKSDFSKGTDATHLTFIICSGIGQLIGIEIR